MANGDGASNPLLSEYFNQKEAADGLQICPRTLDRWRRLGEGPPVTKIGRRIFYKRTSVQKWLAAQEHQGSAVI